MVTDGLETAWIVGHVGPRDAGCSLPQPEGPGRANPGLKKTVPGPTERERTYIVGMSRSGRGAIRVQGALAKQKPRLEHVGCGAAGQVRGVCPFGHDAADIKLPAPCPRPAKPHRSPNLVASRTEFGSLGTGSITWPSASPCPRPRGAVKNAQRRLRGQKPFRIRV